MTFRLPPIYPITDKRLSGKTTHLAIVRELIRAGATVVQIRDQETPLHQLLVDLRRCVAYAARFSVRILVNNRCDLVLLSDAAGVHLGQMDLPPAAARDLLGRRAIIGFSTHSPAQLRHAIRLPVDYLGFGPIFPTTTKTDSSPAVGLGALRQVCRQSPRPVVAIGGIGLEQIARVRDAGASSVALISAIMSTGNIARAMERCLEAAGRAS